MRAPTVIGYAWSSPTDPPEVLEQQRDRLTRSGCREIFEDVATHDRPEWEHCRASLARRDILVLNAPDRAVCSVSALLALRDELRDRGVSLVILGFLGERLDYREPPSREPGATQLLLEEIAAWERRSQQERQAAGIERAKAEGRFTGGKPRIAAEDVRAKLAAGMTPTEVAREMGIDRRTVYRLREQVEAAASD